MSNIPSTCSSVIPSIVSIIPDIEKSKPSLQSESSDDGPCFNSKKSLSSTINHCSGSSPDVLLLESIQVLSPCTKIKPTKPMKLEKLKASKIKHFKENNCGKCLIA